MFISMLRLCHGLCRERAQRQARAVLRQEQQRRTAATHRTLPHDAEQFNNFLPLPYAPHSTGS